MAAEWTHHVSYSPGLIAVCIGRGKATLENIEKTKEFGVNLAAIDQNALASVAGGSSGRNTNKIEALKELGFKFFKAKKIATLMVEAAAMQAECRLIKKIDIGDHPILIGEIIHLYPANDKEPLAYHGQRYWKLTESIKRPEEDELARIHKIVEKHRR